MTHMNIEVNDNVSSRVAFNNTFMPAMNHGIHTTKNRSNVFLNEAKN